MNYEIKPDLQKILSYLKKKDKEAFNQIYNKIAEIITTDPEHYKNLRYDLKHLKRVHIKKSFVLVFSYDKEKQFISFLDYDHHDNIYKKRFMI